MKIAFLFNENTDKVTGPRNSVTLLAKAVEPIIEKASVYSLMKCDPFLYNEVQVNFLENKAELLDYDFVVFSGIWHPNTVRTARYLYKNDLPYIISPRSSLTKSSFSKSFFKKIIFYALYGRCYLYRARAIHFLTDDEKKNSFHNKRGFVVGNIVNDPYILKNINNEKCIDEEGQSFKIAYLGRLDIHHKGLDRLVRAISFQANKFRNKKIIFQIYGPDKDDNRQKLEKFIQKHNLNDLIDLGPKLTGIKKAEFLKKADIFVHTSRYEGQPQAVMEAMMSECAILVTSGTNMGDIVQKAKCGVLSGSKVEQINKNLVFLINTDLRVKKNNAKEYAINNFSSLQVGKEFVKNISQYV